ncbi:MAG: glycoside hydrolase family 68 protein [Sphingomonas sp.]|uniref:glycoside hydrolase family 68 protein n=1 Tax=Sphingomonas sp. TaxID=28214 RepID=UPI0025EEF67F|nr:glycoside hydrolase family 68 protein [Sphingomonas sp.]MBY0284519.1 glycoside hydrolase family 68 protein [Sphingomonas sp.]
MIPFTWLPSHVAAIRPESMPMSPLFDRETASDVLSGHDVWDHWPVLSTTGALAPVAGGQLVIALAAPRLPDPDDRHAIARLWLFHRSPTSWRDLGPVFADDAAPGSRQWSGSAIISDAGEAVRLFFTAVGGCGEPPFNFAQRLFETTAQLRISDGVPSLADWSAPIECARPDGLVYQSDMGGGGAIGTIKAFRDPFWFRDADRDEDWLLFTASDAGAHSSWNGVVGAAKRIDDAWVLQPPIVSAIGLNNELERPHVVIHRGQVYLFWSTQAKVFANPGPRGPTGLYGVVADSWGAPWRPINGTALVFANPGIAPTQAYSFQVLPNLTVWSFADMPGIWTLPPDPAARRAAFAGGPAPVLRLALDGDRAALMPS